MLFFPPSTSSLSSSSSSSSSSSPTYSHFLSNFIQHLLSCIPHITTPCGETVQLNTSLEYIACNVEISAHTIIPDNSSDLLQHVKNQLGDRVYNLPAYIFAGNSQLGVIEILRGGMRSMTIGTVQLICKYIDLLDVAIDERTNRCIILTVRITEIDNQSHFLRRMIS